MDHVRRTTLLQRIFQIFTGPDNQVKSRFFLFYFFFFFYFFSHDGFLFYRHCLKESDRRHFFIIEGFEKLKMASNMSANTGFSTIIIISYNDFKYVCAYFVIKSWRMIKGETSLVLRRL